MFLRWEMAMTGLVFGARISGELEMPVLKEPMRGILLCE